MNGTAASATNFVMRLLPILSIVSLAAAPAAIAQVTVDLHALQALPEHPAAPEPLRRAPGKQIRHAPVAETPKAHSQDATNTTLPLPAAQQPALPQEVPQTAAIPPIAPPAPASGAAAPPPPPVSANAGTVATPVNEGLRVTFTPGQSDLTPESVTAIKKLTSDVTLGDTTSFNVSAFAPGTSDDPSTARRLSLSRAMAVRGALVADGVPSPRIFVRALGAEYGNGPADRVDIDVQGAVSEAVSK